MKLNLIFLLTTTLLLTYHSSALADRVKVKKVKGMNAIVESSIPLEEGQTYQIIADPISEEVDFKSSVIKSRNNSISLGANLSYLKTDNADATTFEFQSRYGWNFSSTEVGLLVDFYSINQTGGATTRLLAGGYVDYNIENNRDPKKFIYGPFALLAFGSNHYPDTASSPNTTNLEANVGGFSSFFLGESTTALRAEGYFIYKQLNSSLDNISATGFGSRLLLVYYF